MNDQYESVEIFRGMTKYTHKEFDQIVKKFTKFALIDQWQPEPQKISDFNQFYDQPISPSYGQKLFAVSNEWVVLLIAVIDSSD